MTGREGSVATGRRIARTLAAIVAVTAAVWLGDVAPASSGTDDTAVDEATIDAGALMSTVPVDVRGSCLVGDASDTEDLKSYGLFAGTLTATLSCHPSDDLDVVFYDQFPDAATMRGAFDFLYPNQGYPDEFDACPAYSTYQRGDEDAGVVACIVEGEDVGEDDGVAAGTIIVAWTYEPESTIVQVLAADADDAWEFFEDDGGPLSERSDDGITSIPTESSLRASARRLFRVLPKAARQTCTVVDRFSPDTLQNLYPARLFIVADVEECRFRGGIEAEYVQFASRASMNAHFDQFADADEGRRVAKLGTFTCPGSGNYDKGTGRWTCYVADVDADANASEVPHAIVAWTNEDLDVYAFGAAPASDAKRLLQWFVNEAGPNP
jgi:hypothetical protein